MTNAERLLLEDAIETALKAEISRQKLKRALIITSTCCALFAGVIGGLLLWIVAY